MPGRPSAWPRCPNSEPVIIGDFEVLETLGFGGSGVVYKARNMTLGRVVALKQIRCSPSEDASDTEQILAEARMMASINSDHVVTVYQAKVIDGQPTLEMEFMEGGALDRTLEAGLPLEEALSVIQQLLAGLDAIHAAGLVHRDIKPGNLLSNGRGRYKIADFGISVVAGHRPTLRAGTTQYVAPEVLRPPHQFDQRADLYAAGMTAYEVVLGAPRFREVFAELFQGGGPAADHRWFNWACDPEVESAPLSQLVPGVPAAVSEIVRRLMTKDPDRRLGSAREALDLLAGAAPGGTRVLPALQPAPIPRRGIQPASPPQPPPLPPTKKRGLVPLLVGGLVLCISLIVLVLLLSRGGGRIDVRVDSDPSGAWLERPGGRVRTPFTFQQVEVGSKHELTLKRPGFEDLTVTFEPKSGETAVRFPMKPRCATATRADAPLRVRLDGMPLASVEPIAALAFVGVVGPDCPAEVVIKQGEPITISDGQGEALGDPVASSGEAAIGEIVPRLRIQRLVSLLTAGVAAGAAGTEVQVAVTQPGASPPSPDPSFRVSVSAEQTMTYWIRPAHERLLLLELSPTGELYVVFPASFAPDFQPRPNLVVAGQWLQMPPIKPTPPLGRELLVAISFDARAQPALLERDYPGLWTSLPGRDFRKYQGDGALAFAEKLVARLAGPGWSGAVTTFTLER